MVEIQGTAEKTPFSRDELNALMDLAEAGCKSLFQIQLDAFNKALDIERSLCPILVNISKNQTLIRSSDVNV